MAGHPTEINTPTPRTVSNIESSFPLIDQTKKRIKNSEKYKIDWVSILLDSRNVLFFEFITLHLRIRNEIY